MPFDTRNVQFVFARHGHADPAEPGQRDQDRPLSEKGVQQVFALRDTLSHKLFDLALVSPTLRNFETARIVLNGAQTQTRIAQSLYSHPISRVDADIGTMFAELGHSPLRAYFGHEKAAALRTFATEAATYIKEVVDTDTDTETGSYVFISGNGVLMNAIIHEMFPACAENMLDFVFEECGAVEITVDQLGKVIFDVLY